MGNYDCDQSYGLVWLTSWEGEGAALVSPCIFRDNVLPFPDASFGDIMVAFKVANAVFEQSHVSESIGAIWTC